MNKCRLFLNSSFLLHQSVWRKPSPLQSNKAALLLNVPFYREKGHSKWQNIRHIKEAKDQEKSKVFNTQINLMRIAIAEGGSTDPAINTKLANVIYNAKKLNMPVATIQNFLKNLKEKPLQAVWFELKGPKGCVMYISTLSPQASLVKQTIRSTVKRLKCRQMEFCDRMAKAVFDHKGLILASPPPDMKNIEETSLGHAIEVGAEEVCVLEDDSNTLEFITPASSMHKARNALEELNYTIKAADCVYIPKAFVELEEEDLKLLNNLYEELDKMPEVVQIYTNF